MPRINTVSRFRFHNLKLPSCLKEYPLLIYPLPPTEFHTFSATSSGLISFRQDGLVQFTKIAVYVYTDYVMLRISFHRDRVRVGLYHGLEV